MPAHSSSSWRSVVAPSDRADPTTNTTEGTDIRRTAKESIPVRFAVPGATARQFTDFGDATGYGAIGGEYFSLAAGTDIAPLLQGLAGDTCHAPHWDHMVAKMGG